MSSVLTKDEKETPKKKFQLRNAAYALSIKSSLASGVRKPKC